VHLFETDYFCFRQQQKTRIGKTRQMATNPKEDFYRTLMHMTVSFHRLREKSW